MIDGQVIAFFTSPKALLDGFHRFRIRSQLSGPAAPDATSGYKRRYKNQTKALYSSNLLQNPNFEYNAPIAASWDSELEYLDHDAVYYRVPDITGGGGYSQRMTFTGWAVEPQANKVEIFQSVYGTTPEENLTFSIWLKGDPSNTRVIIGIETFTIVGDPLYGGREWIAEKDEIIQVDNTLRQYNVSYKMLPGTNSAAVYVHFNQITPATRMNIF